MKSKREISILTSQSRFNAGFAVEMLCVVALLGILAIVQSGCSQVTNVAAGLITPQSTISGSNYVFYVDPITNRLCYSLNPSSQGGDIIRADANFAIYLDGAFLRYIQGVDPYVLVYSEAWMGSAPAPSNHEDVLRRVVLLKDGLGQNARLPITNGILLGPVTLTSFHPVTVCIKVVVLSKKDNATVVGLLNGIESVASTAAPQYSAAAAALGSAAKMVVAQNQDKVEFEHTITFFPVDKERNDSKGAGTNKGAFRSDASLREGPIVIIKGENEDRRVPPETWWKYLVPANWAGRSPDSASRRIEEIERKERHYMARVFSGFVRHIIRLPYCVIEAVFSPSEWGTPVSKDACELTSLTLNGHSLVQPICEKNTTGTLPVKTMLYSDKTHFIIRIEKCNGSYGDFAKLLGNLDAQNKLFDSLFRRQGSGDDIYQAEIEAVVNAAKVYFQVDGAKNRIDASAKKGTLTPAADLTSYTKDIRSSGDKTLLAERAIRKAGEAAVDRYVGHARKQYIDYRRVAATTTGTPRVSIFDDLTSFILETKWAAPRSDDRYKTLWESTWVEVLNEVRETVLDFGDKDILADFAAKKDDWEALKTLKPVEDSKK